MSRIKTVIERFQDIRSSAAIPCLAISAIFIVSFIIAITYLMVFRSGGGQEFFYQISFEPAVQLACGFDFGINSAGLNQNQSLLDFLQLKKENFSCADLPQSPQIKESQALAWYYMLLATGYIWRVTGVSWPAVDVLVSLLFGLSVCATYGIFRLGMGTLLSAIGTMIFATSSFNLTHLIFMRDYSKAPFILTCIMIMGILVTKSLNTTKLAVLAGIAGIVAGVGYGFRPDVLIIIPPMVAVILLFLPENTLKLFPRNLFVTGAFLAGFWIAASPIFSTVSKFGGCQWHFPILGAMSPFSRDLQISEPVYSFGNQFNDALAWAMVESYADRVLEKSPVGYCTSEYDQSSRLLFLNYASYFPADILIRAFSSISHVMNIGFHANHPTSLNNVLTSAKNYGLPIYIILIFALAAFSLRLAIFVLLFVVYFAGYPAMQFSLRHFFHLEFMTWWPIGFFLACCSGLIMNPSAIVMYFTNWKETFSKTAKSLAQSAIFIVSITSLVVVVTTVFRFYQDIQVRKIIKIYQDAPKEKINISSPEFINGESLFKLQWNISGYEQLKDRSHHSEMVHVTLGGESCAGGNVEITMKYKTANPGFDFLNKVSAELPVMGKKSHDVYMPVYFIKELSIPDAIVISSEKSTCLLSVERIVDRKFFPIWLTISLPQDWEKTPLYQRYTY